MRSCWARFRKIASRVCGSGGLDVGDEPGLEAVAQAVFELVEVAGRAVGGEDELVAGVVEGVEGVEELLLGARLALEELNVVEEQYVELAEAALEAVGAARRQGVQELAGEGLAGGVARRQTGAVGVHAVAIAASR